MSKEGVENIIHVARNEMVFQQQPLSSIFWEKIMQIEQGLMLMNQMLLRTRK